MFPICVSSFLLSSEYVKFVFWREEEREHMKCLPLVICLTSSLAHSFLRMLHARMDTVRSVCFMS
jgi:hypothetical protein